MRTIPRREILKRCAKTLGGLLAPIALAGCRRVVQVERLVPVEKEVTKIVREIVRETVIVGGTPRVVIATPQVIEKQVTAEPAPHPPGTLVIDALDYGWTQFAMQMTPAFQEVFPNIKVQWRQVSDWRDHGQAIASSYVSGIAADVVDTLPGTLPALWRSQKMVRPLDDLLETEGFDSEGIFTPALESFRVADEQVGVPFVAHPGEGLLLHRPSLFAQAEVERPNDAWDLDDLDSVSAKFRSQADAARPAVFAHAIDLRLPDAYSLLHLFGGSLLTMDGRHCLADQREATECLSWAHEQIHVKRQTPAATEMVRSRLGMFQDGRLAMMRAGLYRADLMMGQSVDGDLGVSLFPSHPMQGRRGSLLSGVGYCISSETSLASEALLWIKYLCAREMGVQMFLSRYAEPGCRVASWTDPRVLDRFPLCVQLAELCETADQERLPWNLQTGACLEAWNEAWARLYTDGRSPEATSAAACRLMSLALEKPPLGGDSS